MTSLTSGRFQPPLSLTEGNTVDFVFRLSNNGTLFTPPLTPVWIFGIKDADTPNGDFLIQVNSATSASGVFTFVVELASAELQAWLATATSQSYAAIQITDSANDIATAPLLCQIAPNQNDTGTTPTSANGILVVAATKTVTFPQSLTFPSALGTNGFQLSTDGAGALTWTASGALTDGDKGDITVSNSGATFTIDNDVVGLAQLAHMATARVVGRTTAGTGAPELLTISGTGSVAMTNTPTLVTPALGAATATSINGITISAGGSGTLTMAGSIDTSALGGSIVTNGNLFYARTGGSINTSGFDQDGGSIDTSGNGSVGGSIDTSDGGGSITTNGNGSIGLGIAANRITLVGTTASNGKTATFPNVTGTVAVAATSATATQALFATATAGAPAYRAIATADIATALTTPGAIGGTTASTGAFTTLTGTTINGHTFTAGSSTFTGTAGQTYTFPTTTATLARTDAAQTFTGDQTFGVISATSITGVTAVPAAGGIGRGSAGNRVGLYTTTGGLFFDGGTDGLVKIATGYYLQPTTNNNSDFGSSSLRWAKVFSVLGDFSGAMTLGSTLAVSGATTLTGNLTSNGALISTPQALSGNGAVAATSVATLTTTIANTGTANTTTTLAAGTNGQIKVISFITDGGFDGVVTVTNPAWGGAGTITMNDALDNVMLIYLNSLWQVLINNGCTLA